jgi:hypothetical protein
MFEDPDLRPLTNFRKLEATPGRGDADPERPKALHPPPGMIDHLIASHTRFG